MNWFAYKKAPEFIYKEPFIDLTLKSKIECLKNKLDDVNSFELADARRRYDGYYIKNVWRGAIKMANLDQKFGIIDKLQMFGDIGGAPGGFAEYILHRNQNAIGYGMTLNNDYKFKSDRFHVVRGLNGDGDITCPDNLKSFPTNLDFIVGDVACNTSGMENFQENMHLELYYAQANLALSSCKIGGCILLKFFDTCTLQSIFLLYKLSQLFKRMCIYKPESSRPANAERYIFFVDCVNNNCTIDSNSAKLTESFYTYICATNNWIGEKQYEGLLRLISYLNNNKCVKRNFIRRWNLKSYIQWKQRSQLKYQ